MRSDEVFAWELADYGADSVGCGLSGVECTSRVPMTSCGSSVPMGGLGSSRRNIPRPLFEPCWTSRMQSPNNRFQETFPLRGPTHEPERSTSVSIS